jgi:hypothetical protein
MEQAMPVHTRFVVKLIVLAACAVVASSAAQAVDNTRYVSINGSNANACSLAAPCLTLQRGINMTPAGGELRILDSGFYGNNATVNRSMTISGNGNTVFLGAEITIDSADAMVVLRDLTLNGQGAIANDIHIVAAAAVHIERCVIHNFTRQGINLVAAAVEIFVVGSVSRDNGLDGLRVDAGNLLTVENSRFDNNGTNGVFVFGSYGTIRRSSVSGNRSFGIVGRGFVSVISTTATHNGTTGFQVTEGSMTVDSSLASGNGHAGLVTDTTAIARISNSTFTGNSSGIINTNIIETRRNNTVRGNGTDLQGNVLTPIGGV